MPPAKKRDPRKPPARPRTRYQPGTPPEVVDPIWLIKALGLSFLAALVCAWLAVCLLFYQGEWQLVLHPSRTIDRTPASAGIAYEQVRFDAAETGQARLTGWWVPALNERKPSLQLGSEPSAQLSLQQTPKYAAYTILYLHDGSLSLSATVPTLALLHRSGINVFALDYRGFGESDPSDHPTEARMAQDAAAALDYLTSTRNIPAANIIPYGAGLGASLAVNLALHHPEFPALILDNPNPNPTATAVASRPSRLVPVRLLFRERFEIAAPLSSLTTPKLLIAGGPNSASSPDSPEDPSAIGTLQALFSRAASPRLTVTLPANADADYQSSIARFLDQYLSPTAH